MLAARFQNPGAASHPRHPLYDDFQNRSETLARPKGFRIINKSGSTYVLDTDTSLVYDLETKQLIGVLESVSSRTPSILDQLDPRDIQK